MYDAARQALRTAIEPRQRHPGQQVAASEAVVCCLRVSRAPHAKWCLEGSTCHFARIETAQAVGRWEDPTRAVYRRQDSLRTRAASRDSSRQLAPGSLDIPLFGVNAHVNSCVWAYLTPNVSKEPN